MFFRKVVFLCVIVCLCGGLVRAQVPDLPQAPTTFYDDLNGYLSALSEQLAGCTEVITADDNGVTLQAALNTSVENATICTPSGPGVTISTNLTVPGHVNFMQYSPLMFSGTGTALTIGSITSQPAHRTYRLWITRATQSLWTSDEDIGVRFINVSTSDIHLVEIQGFTIGVQYLADGGCACYNQTKVHLILNNKIGIDLTQQHSGAPNANTFWGGRFTHNSGIGVGLARYGVRFNSLDLTYVNTNENRFYAPCFELGKSWAGVADAVPILMLHGQNNAVMAARSEGNSPHFADVRNMAQLNQFDILFLGGTSELKVLHSPTNPGDSLLTGGGQLKVQQQASLDIWTSGAFHKTWTNGITIPGVVIGSSSSAIESPQGTGLIATATYVEVPGFRSLVRYVSTETLKRFVIFLDADTGFGGRVRIRAYDAFGNILDSTSAEYPNVVGLSGAGFSYSSSYGGAYVTGGDSTSPRYFRVTDAVKSVAVLLTGGSLPLRIRGFRIAAVDATGHAATWTNFDR